MGTYRNEGDRYYDQDHNHPEPVPFKDSSFYSALLEWATYGVVFGTLLLFFLGVYVLADLVF